jgi:tetratricopeptide (TPR) repeat protein
MSCLLRVVLRRQDLLWISVLSVVLTTFRTATAVAAPCEPVPIAAPPAAPESVLAEARARIAEGRREQARSLLAWLVVRDPRDREAVLALSRLDAWDGCYERAAARYSGVLDDNPRDVEARAGLVDVYIWSGAWSAARATIAEGLSLQPDAPELWLRSARLLYWEGERTAAAQAAERALRAAPHDLELQAFREKLFLGQVRLAGRVSRYPRGYPTLYTSELQIQQFWHRLELGAAAQQIERVGGDLSKPLIDRRYSATLNYYTARRATIGLTMGVGEPAKSIPRLEARPSLFVQLSARWSLFGDYAYWRYRDYRTAHIVGSGLGYAPRDDLLLELRAWNSWILLRPPESAQEPDVKRFVYALGARSTWRPHPHLGLGLGYYYGPQLDRTPASYQFLDLISHVVAVSADWLVVSRWGLVPAVSFERRESATGVVALIYTGELASYLRW